jgi:FAD/FMN-containing dehydrogenase
VSNQSPLRTLKGTLRGDLIEPGDARYDEVRKVYNGMIDKRPLAIAMCLDVADVSAAVLAGADHGLPVAIRGGGHNAGGLGICDDGLVIDLSHMKQIEVDAAAKTVKVGGGALWHDVDAATHAHGLAVPAGIISTTGVGGLSLGGGVGHLTRKCGLTIDNIVGAEMVLADGETATVNKEQHADLFWAIRGGGGNFGIVTEFKFRAHAIHTDIAGPMLWPLERSKEILQWYADFLPKQPDELNGFFAFLTVPPGPPFPEALHLKPMCGIVWCYVGPPDQADKVFAPIRALKPALDLVGPIPHPAVQSMFDPLLPPGLQWYWKADFVKELSSAAIDRNVEHGAKMPTMLSTMHMYPVDGAAGRVGRDETPWAYRDARWAQVIVGIDPDPANRDTITAWSKNYFDAIHPYSAGGAYVNFMMEEGDDRVKATYRDHYPRLASVKAKYDPSNLFCVNQNIKPGAPAV